ncbi:MAG: VWA domain-containing protein [Planctomycetes bacterium]|nr:VWA domain-containing protein [Planctomycetota bacterium]
MTVRLTGFLGGFFSIVWTLVLFSSCTGGYAPHAAEMLASGYVAAPSPTGATAGATAGGEQNIGLARQTIASGSVPRPGSFSAEGLFSEHDIATEGRAADRVLSLRPGLALLRLPDSEAPSAIIQVGMASNVDLSTFRRRPQNLAVVVDRSGSMSGEKIKAVRRALHRLVDQLGPEDSLALVLFDSSAEVVLESAPVEEKGTIEELVDEIEADGSTDIEEGLRLGYEEVSRGAGRAGRADRVILFTDALPNTGRTDEESFLALARSGAKEGIGLTVFGVGLDLGWELARAISELEGGNYFYLEDADRIGTVFDRDLDLLVTPIAYRLRLAVEPAPGFRTAAVYGVPGSDPSRPASALELEVATVFLSRNRGAIALRLEPESGAMPAKPGFRVATVRLTYRTPGGEDVREEIAVAYEGTTLAGRSTWFSGPGARKLAILVEEYATLEAACRAYHEESDAPKADRLLAALEETLAGEAASLSDDGLREELEMVRRLRENVGREAPARGSSAG